MSNQSELIEQLGEPRVKCWQITPYHNSDADYAIFPIRNEQSQCDALEYAKDRLEEQWHAAAHDETIKPVVAMAIVTMTEAEIAEMTERGGS